MNEKSDLTLANANRNGASLKGEAKPVDVLALVEVLLHRWRWLLIGGVALCFIGIVAGLIFWKTSYTAPAQLIRYDSPNAAEVFGQRQAAPETLPSILHSPELLQRVASRADPLVSSTALAANLRVMPEHDSDIIVVAVTGADAAKTRDLVNLYASEAVRYTQEMQTRAAAEVVRFSTQQLARVESEIAVANQHLQGATPGALTNLVAPPASALIAKIQDARNELAGLLGQYTEAHPLVQAKRGEIKALQDELDSEATSDGATDAVASADSDPDVMRIKLQTLESARLTLMGRAHAAQSLMANPPGYCRLLAPAVADDVVRHGRKAKVLFLGAFMGLLGIVGAAAVVLMFEFMDDRLKNVADVKRVARLPVLATAGDFGTMSAKQLDRWAFRSWTSLQGRLSQSPNHGLVCGVTSSGHGEGRSTWVNRLAHVASQQGFRVLTIATRPSSAIVEADEVNGDPIPGDTSFEKHPATPETNGSDGEYGRLNCPHCGVKIEYPVNAGAEFFACPECSGDIIVPTRSDLSAGDVAAIQKNILASPKEIAQKLMGSESEPIVRIPLPGWVWNLERRKQWQAALHDWSQIENVVILVELPPADEPEAVLLAENLPNIIWLAASGVAGAADTCEQLETLRHAHCKLAGAVLNNVPRSLFHRRFRRWLGGFIVLGALNLPFLHAAEDVDLPDSINQAAATNLSFSVVSPDHQAEWQQHFTLGAGDVLNLSLYDQPKLTQLNVPVGPDGHISFLEAQDVQAAGLTVDELRARLDEELAKYRRAPRTIITPVAFNSKKYYLLGSVVHEGVFTLDRPVTIIEAIARARGLQTVLQQHDLVEIADLQRAFLVRHGVRLPVDFGRLFGQGDLSQNVQLAPGDYLYFPPADLKQIYVVGEVVSPGIAPWTSETSALRAIAEQGGFTSRAWMKKVLVIRGSLEHPQAFVLNASAVLSARAPDFKLQPDDIVYVHYRPWIKAEELMDIAATAFAQSATIYWTGMHFRPLITHPFIK
jgi:protein involved in polysaccharide export with SLBB domain/capsular polysaccharide biosynthesis protein